MRLPKFLTLLLIVSCSVALLSCGKDSDKSTDAFAQFKGSWAGHYTGDHTCIFTLEINEAGIVEGYFFPENNGDSKFIKGTVEPTGKLTCIIDNDDDTDPGHWIGTLKEKDGNGSWQEYDDSGTWEGKKQ